MAEIFIKIGPKCTERSIFFETLTGELPFVRDTPITNEIVFEIEKFRQENSFPHSDLLKWCKVLFQDCPNLDAIRMSFSRIYKRVVQDRRCHVKNAASYRQSFYALPKMSISGEQKLAKDLSDSALKFPEAPLQAAARMGEVLGKFKRKCESEVLTEREKQQKLEGDMMRTNRVLQDALVQQEELRAENATLRQTNVELEEKVGTGATKRTYNERRGFRRRIETKDNKISHLKSQLVEMTKIKQKAQTLEGKLATIQEETDHQVQMAREQHRHQVENMMNQKADEIAILKKEKIAEQKKVSYLKSKQGKNTSDLQEVKSKLSYLENRACELEDILKDLVDTNAKVKTKDKGKYTNTIREVYYSLLKNGVSIKNCQDVIRTVVDKLTDSTIEDLPSKSLASTFMAEACILSRIQVGETLEGGANCLHIDGSTKSFSEVMTASMSTSSGECLSLGYTDMPGGSAADYMDCTRDVFLDVVNAILPTDASLIQKYEKLAALVTSIKCTMTDRHIVNHAFNSHLDEYKRNLLPLVVTNYSSMSDDEKAVLEKIHHLYCGMHAVSNMGSVAKEGVKAYEKVVYDQNVPNAGFQTSDARSVAMLTELSKLFSQGHGNQRYGLVQSWVPFLEKKQKQNRIVNFKGERINIIFVIAGAVFYHKEDIIEFLHDFKDGQDGNRLTAAILQDIANPVFQAIFRALGIVGKLITSPLLRLIEDKERHILSLNCVWEDLVKWLDGLSVDATPLMEQFSPVTGGTVHTDDIYNALFHDTGDEKFDNFTEECLRLLCCHMSVLLKRQLADQLEGGEYYCPSSEVMKETVSAPSHNMANERDFALLGHKLLKSPNLSTISASGTTMFMSNKTDKWLEGLDAERRDKYIQRARERAPIVKKEGRERKKVVTRKRLDKLEEKKIKKLKKEAANQQKKSSLTDKIEACGGLWKTEQQMVSNIATGGTSLGNITAQMMFRKTVLGERNKQLNLSCANHKFSLKELKENMSSFFKVSTSSEEPAVSAPVSPVQVLQVRADAIHEAKESLMQKQQAKKKVADKTRESQIVGKDIIHQWNVEGKEVWYEGKVLQKVGDGLYDVKYSNEDDTFEVELEEDLGKDAFIIS